MHPCFLDGQPFRAVLEALQDGVTIYHDRGGALIWINSKAGQILLSQSERRDR